MNEQADMILMEIDEKMEKSIESLGREFASVRTGRANPNILDRILISYGVDTPQFQDHCTKSTTYIGNHLINPL